MPSAATQDLLKKINYIEVDVEIQKQILFSIPAEQTGEIENTIKLIAEKTREIEGLRKEIKAVDPAEYKRIMIFETAVNNFKELAATHEFESIVSRDIGGKCTLQLKDSSVVECLIKAYDKTGNWTIITLEGEVKQFQSDQVSEKPPEKPTETIPFT